jgi:4-hydroxy-3-methylbut-2-enyl diphosphate reductase
MKRILYLTPSSFCWGVEKSLKDLDRVCEKHPGEPLYCVHAIVHNPGVAQTYAEKGIRFVETIDEITDPEAIVTFSAHGTNRSILDEAKKRFKAVYNLECPLVTKVYKEIDMYAKKGITTFLYIAKEGHQEAKNVIGYIKDSGYTVYHFQNNDEIPLLSADIPFAVLSQTTLNYEHVKSVIEEIQRKYPTAQLPPLTDICKATRERQTVILQNSDAFDALLVLGGKESHNTKELYQL